MKCERCKVEVEPGHTRCPLCQGMLMGKGGGEAVFPRIPPRVRLKRQFIRFALFVSLTGAVISVAVNYMFPTHGWWSLFVIAGIGSFWLSFSVVLRKRGNLNKTILYQVVLISAIAWLWDLGTGFHRWSLEFVVPSIVTCAMIALWVLAKVRHLQVGDYLVYLVMDALVAIVSLLSIRLGLVGIIFPSVICIVVSVLSLTGILIFEGKAVLAELTRRTHV